MLKAKSLMPLAALAGAGLLASACTTSGNVERNAAGGAALGALAGAVIGNNVGSGDAGTGAAIGAALGGGAGAVRGCRQDGGCGAQTQNRRQCQSPRPQHQYTRAFGAIFFRSIPPSSCRVSGSRCTGRDESVTFAPSTLARL